MTGSKRQYSFFAVIILALALYSSCVIEASAYDNEISNDMTPRNSDSNIFTVPTREYWLFTNNNITNSGNGRIIHMSNNASADINNNVFDGVGRAVYVGTGSYADIRSNDITTTGASQNALHIYGANAYANVESNNINVVDGSGVYVTSNATADIRNNVITVTGTSDGTIQNGVGLNGTAANIIDNTINVAGGYGVYLYNNTSGTLIQGNTISAVGDAAYGIYARSSTSAADIVGNVITASDGASGVYSYANSLSLTGNTISVSGGSSSRGIYAASSGFMTLSGMNVINASGSAKAVYAYNSGSGSGAKIDIGSGTVINIEGSESVNFAAFASGSGAVISLDNVQINSGSDRGAYYLRADNGGVINLLNYTGMDSGANYLASSNSTGTINMSNSLLAGDIRHTATNAGTLSVFLTDNSIWRGKTNFLTSGASYDPSQTKINIGIDAGSSWIVTGNSSTHGDLVNNGAIYDQGYTLNVETYDSSGGILYHSISGNAGIVASGAVTGTGFISIGGMADSGAQNVIVISGGTGTDLSGFTTDTATTDSEGFIHAGAWKYSLTSNDTTLSLTRADMLGAGAMTITGYGIVSGIGMSQLASESEVNLLFSRLGIYRDNTYNGGLWAAGVVGKSERDRAYSGFSDDPAKFYGGTVGYDIKYRNEFGTWWVGVMAGYGSSTQDIMSSFGETDLKSYHAALYGVWRGKNGLYGAGIAKYNYYDFDMNINAVDLATAAAGFDKTTGDWDQNGYSVAFLFGKRIDFKNSHGWYIEPQLQVGWAHVAKGVYAANSGINVEIDAVSYIRGRAGLMLGWNNILSNGSILDVYGMASLVHDFSGDTDISIGSGVYTKDLTSTYGLYSIGTNWRYAKDKFVNLRVEYADGDRYSSPFTVYAGLSFEM